jgi:MerR family redox-sensitive transcriptional activator SoxR
MDKLMTIGQVARKAGLKPSAIRYYERLGLIPRAARVNGQRRYDGRVLHSLAIVRFARHVDFSVREIRELLDGLPERPPPARWRKLAASKLQHMDDVIARARRMRKMLGETLAQECPLLVERGLRLRSSADAASRRRGG